MTGRHPAAQERRHSARSNPWRLGLAAIALVAGFLAASSPVLAADPGVKLSLRPVDAGGAYFDLKMQPGEKRTLAVELANLGDAAIAVRSYAADAYTIINGGFGARLRGEPVSGTTTWLDYPTSVTPMAAGQGITRSFTVAVPADAAPGEYITSIILENDVPIQGTGAVTLNQIVRQAMAIVVTIPGPRLPGLAIGAASHKVVAGKSTIAVGVQNTGNVRLKPVVDLVLMDASGAEVSKAQVPMDTFYAQTATQVEVPLAALLQPGQYTIRVVLADAATGARAEADALPLEVVVPPTPADAGIGNIPGLTEVVQSIREGKVPLAVGIAVIVAGLIVGALAGRLILALVRRLRRPG
jgi:hypothetical protein